MRGILRAAGPEGVADLMRCVQFSERLDHISEKTRKAAETLGWLEPGRLSFTKLGAFAVDSCREYVFWRERDRKLPFEGGAAHLMPDHFRNKSVVEIGCGMGANLMSLGGVTPELHGIEPVPIYGQIGSVFRELEGLPSIDIRSGSSEAIPFEDGRFDVVLCVTAHQYFNICPALVEMRRILKPGGEMLIIGGTLGPYMRGAIKPVLRGSPKMTRDYVKTTANSLSYMMFKRRILFRRSNRSTANPIYPARRSMCRWLTDAGFELLPPMVQIPPLTETCFRVRKPA